MDRFIVGVFNRSYAMNFNLKSNMDRFIVNEHYYIPIRNSDLKSNMDRFIVLICSIQI